MKLFKGNEEMIRIVAIAAALLIMFIIIGVSIHSINNVNKINQKHRDEEKGKEIAASFAQTTATTSIWDTLRSTTTVTVSTDEAGNIITEENPDTEITTVVSTGFIVTMD